MILTDPLLIEKQECYACETAIKLGGILALLPTNSLAVTRQTVADEMIKEFVKVRGQVVEALMPHEKPMYDYLN